MLTDDLCIEEIIWNNVIFVFGFQVNFRSSRDNSETKKTETKNNDERLWLHFNSAMMMGMRMMFVVTLETSRIGSERIFLNMLLASVGWDGGGRRRETQTLKLWLDCHTQWDQICKSGSCEHSHTARFWAVRCKNRLAKWVREREMKTN